MKSEFLESSIGTLFGAVGTALQPNEVLRTISLILTIVGSILNFIVLPIINWYRKSKDDGKITHEEVKEVVEIIADGTGKVKEEIDKKGE